MRTVGIIAEFNPFHKGHQYILEKAKAHTDCQRAMVVMSGSFVQRGEPAFFDKWTRAKCALLNGADMVLELPVLFAAANAEIFAMGGVKVLEDTGMTNALCFGSESGDLKALQEAAKIMTNETEEFQRLLKAGLDEGMSYPAARAKALETVSHISSEIISRPNHILGLEYLKALDRLGSSIEPCTIRRKGSQYDNPSLTGEFASAAAIRKGILEENATEAFLQVPENIVDLLTKEISLGTAPASMDELAGALHYKLRTTSAEEIHDILEVTEGLENRILHERHHRIHQNQAVYPHQNTADSGTYPAGYSGKGSGLFPESEPSALHPCSGIPERQCGHSWRTDRTGKMPCADQSEKSAGNSGRRRTPFAGAGKTGNRFTGIGSAKPSLPCAKQGFYHSHGNRLNQKT